MATDIQLDVMLKRIVVEIDQESMDIDSVAQALSDGCLMVGEKSGDLFYFPTTDKDLVERLVPASESDVMKLLASRFGEAMSAQATEAPEESLPEPEPAQDR